MIQHVQTLQKIMHFKHLFEIPVDCRPSGNDHLTCLVCGERFDQPLVDNHAQQLRFPGIIEPEEQQASRVMRRHICPPAVWRSANQRIVCNRRTC